MMEISSKGHGSLPSEEELLKTLEGHYHEDLLHRSSGFYTYLKLFAVICLAAPVAVFFSMMVISGFQSGTEHSAGTKPPEPQSTPVMEKTHLNDRLIESILRELKKSNDRLAAAMTAQTKVLELMASGIPEAFRETAKAAPPVPEVSVEGPKALVVKVPTAEPFDLGYEKIKILQLCGLDLDDPITGPGKLAEMENVEVVREVIHSFDIILASSRENRDVSPFIRGNVLKGRKYAIEQLKKIK